MSKDAEWHAVVARLRKAFPTKRRLIIRRVYMQAFGCTNLTDDEQTITITIRATDSIETQIDTLVHEYAHALEYDKWGNHSDRWGKLHAAVYSEYVSYIGEAT
jgi:hypothetical protein